MFFNKILLPTLLLFVFTQLGYSQNISKDFNQKIAIEKNLPTTMYVNLSTTNVLIKKAAGNEILVEGTVDFSVPYKNFLENLVKNNRYEIIQRPNELRNVVLEDKYRNPLNIGGKTCQETLTYTIHVPKNIKKVIVENPDTGYEEVYIMTPVTTTASTSQIIISQN